MLDSVKDNYHVLVLVDREHPYISEIWPDQDQEASKGVPVKEEQSISKCKQGSGFVRNLLIFIKYHTCNVEGAYRKVAKSQGNFPAIFGTHTHTHTPLQPDL
eukprot:1161744-Pelagomonas_calceolata.AAC.5